MFNQKEDLHFPLPDDPCVCLFICQPLLFTVKAISLHVGASARCRNNLNLSTWFSCNCIFWGRKLVIWTTGLIWFHYLTQTVKDGEAVAQSRQHQWEMKMCRRLTKGHCRSFLCSNLKWVNADQCYWEQLHSREKICISHGKCWHLTSQHLTLFETELIVKVSIFLKKAKHISLMDKVSTLLIYHTLKCA